MVRPVEVRASPAPLSWANRFRVRQYLKGNLWFVPLLGALAGPLLAAGDLWLEDRVRVPDIASFTSATASGILTSIAGAMVALLGFVVTIGVLVVQSATNTLSPRVMRLWYRDPLQKAVLATFAGTFTFAFTLLTRVDEQHIPGLGVTVAGGLVTLSLAMLLVYLDRFTHALRPAAVGAQMVKYGLRVLRSLTRNLEYTERSGAHALPPARVPDLVVRSGRAGVMQAVDAAGLLGTARRHDCLVVLCLGQGDFVAYGAPLFEVYAGDAERGLPRGRDLAGRVTLGLERTIDQDPAFAMRIQVDIAIRALSPGVNDPTTAVQMINHIEMLLEAVAASGHPTGAWTMRDRDGAPRVILPGRRFDQYLQLAVTEIREYGAGSSQVCRRLSAMLHTLAAGVDPDERHLVEAELGRLGTDAALRFPDPEDLAFVRTPDSQGIGGHDPVAATDGVPDPDGHAQP